MTIVSDTSPVLNLAAIGSLHLLGSLYPSVIIPPAVQAELASLAQRQSRFAASAPAALPSFLRVEPLSASALALAAEFRRRLHPGEAEALALAIDLQADLLLLDERAARLLARQQGLRTRGLLGVLVAAKRRRLLPAVAPLLDRLDREAHFHMSALLRADVLRSVGEMSP